MVDVADLSDSAEKFQRRASNAGTDYESGVNRVSDSEQQQATLDSATSWEQGVQNAISENRFERGVQNPNRSWQQASINTGRQRFTQGAGNAGDVWQQSFQPFADVLEGLNLPARGPRGSADNQQRSIQVQEALNDARTQG